jgi:sialic acid synthase SpsE/D-lyxose ketol-isomerase
MKNANVLNNLFIFDLANNHEGDIQHGLEIIKGIGEVAYKNNIKAAIKFQFRNLDSIVHPDYKDRPDVKHIPRFKKTALQKKDYIAMIKAIKDLNMYTMSTPFDEESVDLIDKLEIDIVKIASCSADDKPLINKVLTLDKPIIVSTGGLCLNKIDYLVNSLKESEKQFAIMHCVSIYPTPKEKLNLNKVSILKDRYPDVIVGFSTHEEPNNYDAIKVAYAKGARIFERHVSVSNNKYKLNSYSSTPKEIDNWLEAYKEVKAMQGAEEDTPVDHQERESLNTLYRGVYVNKKIKKGDIITRNDVFFAMPLLENQLRSANWSNNIKADRDYDINSPLNVCLSNIEVDKEQLVNQIMFQVKAMLNIAKVPINKDCKIEISHHYGIERFREFGCVIFSCINREYCKKIIVQLPRQKNPYHYHEKKEETFQLLSGDMVNVIDGIKQFLEPGDISLVPKKTWHKFQTLNGAIIEEVSTTHYNKDSFYNDEEIALIPREKRKTVISEYKSALFNLY